MVFVNGRVTTDMMDVAPVVDTSSALQDLGGLVDESGKRFNDLFMLRTRLGTGCSAQVHIVRDVLGDDAACKLARLQPRMRWNRVTRTFQREAMLLQRCVHPNVIGIRGLFLSGTEAALVLELAPNGDCQQLVQRHGALAESAVVHIMSQLCSALEALHSKGVLHRDSELAPATAPRPGLSESLCPTCVRHPCHRSQTRESAGV